MPRHFISDFLRNLATRPNMMDSISAGNEMSDLNVCSLEILFLSSPSEIYSVPLPLAFPDVDLRCWKQNDQPGACGRYHRWYKSLACNSSIKTFPHQALFLPEVEQGKSFSIPGAT
ncbi:MAG: hypothetical protein IPJ75_16050 [Ignavibacteriales bacterium]|nr:hypothetical protein [Ignavibacteriales bacterium]